MAVDLTRILPQPGNVISQACDVVWPKSGQAVRDPDSPRPRLWKMSPARARPGKLGPKASPAMADTIAFETNSVRSFRPAPGRTNSVRSFPRRFPNEIGQELRGASRTNSVRSFQTNPVRSFPRSGASQELPQTNSVRSFLRSGASANELGQELPQTNSVRSFRELGQELPGAWS